MPRHHSQSSTQTERKEQRVDIGRVSEVERKGIVKKYTTSESMTEPLEPTIVLQEVIREIIKEKDLPPVSRAEVSTSTNIVKSSTAATNTEQPTVGKVDVGSFKTFPRAKPAVVTSSSGTQTVRPPSPPRKMTTTMQTQTLIPPPPKLTLAAQTSTLTVSSKPSSPQLLSPTQVFNYSYKCPSPKEKAPSPKPEPVSPNPDYEKLLARLKIYEDQNVKLMMENDKLRNNQTGLYSKLSEKQFDSIYSHKDQTEALKKELSAAKEGFEKAKAEVIRLRGLQNNSVSKEELEVWKKKAEGCRNEAMASSLECENAKKELAELRNRMSRQTKPPSVTVSTETDWKHFQIPVIVPAVPEKKMPPGFFDTTITPRSNNLKEETKQKLRSRILLKKTC